MKIKQTLALFHQLHVECWMWDEKEKLNFKQLSTLKCHRLIFPETNYFRKVLIKFLNSMLKNLFKQNVAKLSEIHQRDKNFCKLLIRIIIRMKVSLMMYWVQFEWGLKHPRREYRDNEEWKKSNSTEIWESGASLWVFIIILKKCLVEATREDKD
jgi:hypothetical protein